MTPTDATVETDPDRSALMKKVRQRDTEPELAVRRILTSLGARYRVNVSGLPGSPDLANRFRGTRLHVIVTRDGSPAMLHQAGISYSQLSELPA